MVYEVSWHRLLSLALGATLRSAALVLTIYMIGMGLGAWYFGNLADRVNRLQRLLAGLHWGMALSGGLGLALLSAIPNIYRSASLITAGVLSYATATIALLPGAIAAGAMVPVMSRIFISKNDDLGTGLGTLYTLEALGSVSGSLAVGFVMLPFFGQTASVFMAMAVNLTAGLAVLSIKDISPGEKSLTRPRPKQAGDEKIEILLVALAIGFIGLGLQVAWNRAVSIYLPNSSYTFALVAAVYLIGVVVGNMLFSLGSRKMGKLRTWLWSGLGLAFVATATSALILEPLPKLVLFPSARLLSSETARIFLPPLLVSLALAFIPTVILGFCSPLACRLYAERPGLLGRDVGRLRAVNTLGSALGPVLAGLVFIPLLGLWRTLWVFAGLAALASLAVSPNRIRTIASLSLTAVAAFLTLAVAPARILPPSLYGSGFGSSRRQDMIIYYHETAEGTVIVTEDGYTGIRACYVNNSAVVGTTYDAIKVVKMLGHLPILCGAGPGKALVVGFGIGVTASTVAGHDQMERVDCVEIVPGVRGAAGFFNDFNRGVLGNPKIRFIDGDGRHYLNRTREIYQIISADPTHPTLGCAQLYTEEYFSLCRDHLSEDGIVCQYLPFHGLTPDEFQGAVATFRSVFPHSSLWLGQAHGVLLGSKRPLSLDFGIWQDLTAGIQDPLFYKDPYAIAACLLLDESGLKELAGNFRVNRDDKNYLEFFRPQAKSPGNWERNVSKVFAGYQKSARAFNNIKDSVKWNRYRDGQSKFIQALIKQNQGDRKGMIEFMRQAIIVAPENEEFRFLMQNELERQGVKQ